MKKSVKNYPTFLGAHEVTVIDKKYIVEFWYESEVDCWYAWLTKPNFGVKDMMFGWPKHQPNACDGHTEFTFEEFVEMVYANLLDYIQTFEEEYED